MTCSILYDVCSTLGFSQAVIPVVQLWENKLKSEAPKAAFSCKKKINNFKLLVIERLWSDFACPLVRVNHEEEDVLDALNGNT